jgi:hypothetical protein
MCRRFHIGIVVLVALSLGSVFATSNARSQGREEPQTAPFAFEGSRAEAERFIGYYDSIELTAAQEAVRKEALQAMPAPCCSNFSAATCCCECNMARTIWGLSKFLITQEGRGAEEVREAASAWVHSINPSGYTGDACFTGGCGRSFKEGGCGGMHKNHLTVE